MKRSFLLFPMVLAFGYITLSSNSLGPAHSGNGNRTASGPNPGCAGSSCHGPNNTTTVISLALTDQAGQPVTNGKYTPNAVYTITLGGANPAASKFGFQTTVVKAGNLQAGSLASPTPSSHDAITVGGISVMEHRMAQGASGSGSFGVTFTWTAPPVGTGNVTFHTTVNALNSSAGADQGDHASLHSLVLAEQAASVTELDAAVSIVAYPNPASSHVTLRFEHAATGSYNIVVFDLTGRPVHKQDIHLASPAAETQIQTSGWSSGTYFAYIVKDGARRIITISK